MLRKRKIEKKKEKKKIIIIEKENTIGNSFDAQHKSSTRVPIYLIAKHIPFASEQEKRA